MWHQPNPVKHTRHTLMMKIAKLICRYNTWAHSSPQNNKGKRNTRTCTRKESSDVAVTKDLSCRQSRNPSARQSHLGHSRETGSSVWAHTDQQAKYNAKEVGQNHTDHTSTDQNSTCEGAQSLGYLGSKHTHRTCTSLFSVSVPWALTWALVRTLKRKIPFDNISFL